jgi:MYXO-CTERM domain-containing protein
MSRRPLGLCIRSLLALPCLVVPVLSGVLTSPVSADPVSHCTSTSGVIVVVDFRHVGGAVDRGCGATPTTGYDALHHAGFSTAGDDQDGPAFVCRIDDLPSPAQQSCARTPPTSASWSYWHANPGQNSWAFSELGAMSTHPQPGSVDAWVYGSTVGGGQTGQPSFTPASVRATPASPKPVPSATHSSAGSPTRHHHVARVTASPSATATATPSPVASTSAHRTRHHNRHPAAVTAPTASPTFSPGLTFEANLTPDSTSTGSPTGLIVGVVLVVGLGGIGGAVAWRRRRASP